LIFVSCETPEQSIDYLYFDYLYTDYLYTDYLYIDYLYHVKLLNKVLATCILN